MRQRRLPAVAVVRGRGDVDLDARLVEREARERHVVLPADQAADPSERRLERPQAAPVALAPDEPLVVRRHELAVVERELARRRPVEQRVVERSRPLRVGLVDADDEPDAVLARDRGEPVGVGARHLERLAVQERERLLRPRLGPAGERLRPRRGRVGGDEGLREDDELRAGGGRLRRPLGDPVDRAGAVEDRGLDLDAGGGDALPSRPLQRCVAARARRRDDQDRRDGVTAVDDRPLRLRVEPRERPRGRGDGPRRRSPSSPRRRGR